eukprot:TRINITY_DN28016_c0_g1_i1.p1 TRINITY_DN28016_c0_g1~~TRINITY_DN28016_c0_g1_i1.p1  ORF type:complete len:243 (+),score=43.74 TRINITY_DN28016_c0_g1_i1:73-801(+)
MGCRLVPAILLTGHLLLGVASSRPYGNVTTAGKSTNIAWHEGVSREEKWKAVGHKGLTIWMTGLSGSGKRTISEGLERALSLQSKPYFVYRLDADHLRTGLNSDLDFSPEARKENVRRIAEVSRLFAESGAITVVSLVSPYKVDRDYAREVHKNGSLPFLEVFLDAPLDVLKKRDPRGLYAQHAAGQLQGLPGLDADFDRPEAPDIHLRTAESSFVECVNVILSVMDAIGVHLPRKFRRLQV